MLLLPFVWTISLSQKNYFKLKEDFIKINVWLNQKKFLTDKMLFSRLIFNRKKRFFEWIFDKFNFLLNCIIAIIMGEMCLAGKLASKNGELWFLSVFCGNGQFVWVSRGFFWFWGCWFWLKYVTGGRKMSFWGIYLRK